MDKEARKEIANEIFEELKEKHLLENDAIAILRDVTWMIREVQSNHEFR
jgi:hypothetical protein